MLAGCGGGGNSTQLNVIAASSLTTALQRIAEEYMADHPGVVVTTTFGGSSTLATQVEQGLAFDVAALADEETMARLAEGSHVVPDSIRVFATNTLAIVVAAGNPLGIGTVDDLRRPGLRVSLCDAAQPCGRYTATILDRAGVNLEATSVEKSASAVAGRVATGEVDAGIAYVTDGRVEGVDTVPIPGALNVTARYPIGLGNDVLSESAAAMDFVSFVVSGGGRRILDTEGFGAP